MSSETQALLRVHEYHGSNRIRDVTKLSNFDLVVTTFETLASDWYSYVPCLPCPNTRLPLSLSHTHHTSYPGAATAAGRRRASCST
jgi:hypothetical protein